MESLDNDARCLKEYQYVILVTAMTEGKNIDLRLNDGYRGYHIS